jgi:ribulose kinase
VLSAEPGLIGAMVLAAVGVGAFASEGAAVAHLVQSAGRFTPNERRAIAYTKLFGVFRNLHDTLQEPFKQAARVVAELDS